MRANQPIKGRVVIALGSKPKPTDHQQQQLKITKDSVQGTLLWHRQADVAQLVSATFNKK